MKQCKKCGIDFQLTKGLINYCSLNCRNSRIWSDNDKLKKSKAARTSEKAIKQRESLKSKEIIDKITKTKREAHKKHILESNYSDLSFESLRARILYEQNEKCNKCGLDEWLNTPLVLELEHKDGNHFNNCRDNLEMLCPNCHSLTSTWRGRNKKERKLRVNDETLLESLLLNMWNFRQSLISVGLAPKGGNYNRCHRLKREYDFVA